MQPYTTLSVDTLYGGKGSEGKEGKCRKFGHESWNPEGGGGGVWAFGGAQEQLILLAPLVPQKSYSSDVVGKMSSLTGSPLQSYLWEKTAFIPWFAQLSSTNLTSELWVSPSIYQPVFSKAFDHLSPSSSQPALTLMVEPHKHREWAYPLGDVNT